MSHTIMDFSETNKPQIASVIRPLRTKTTTNELTRVQSLSFHPTNGRHLFVTSNYGCHTYNTKLSGSSIRMWDCIENRVLQSIQVPQNVNGTVVAVHSEYCCLSTTKHGVEYLSLYDNKVLRTFSYSANNKLGHHEQEEVDVSCISVSPADDTFLTVDNSTSKNHHEDASVVRLWDVGTPNCVAKMKMDSATTASATTPILASFDSTGLVFAISAKMKSGDGNYVHLYDARNYGAGAFAEMTLSRSDIRKALEDKHGLLEDEAYDVSGADWGSLQFSSSGKQVLIGAKRGLAMTIDGFTGALDQIFMDDNDNNSNSDAENNDTSNIPSVLDADGADDSERPVAACFTPDEKTVLVGGRASVDNNNFTERVPVIRCFDSNSGKLMSKLEGHAEGIGCIACSPKYALVASSCVNTALWTWQ